MSKYLRWAELPPRKDVYVRTGNTQWGNYDLYPIPKKERTFTWWTYLSYQIVVGITINGYSTGSSYLTLGLTAGETLGSILAGSVIGAAISYVTARPGLDHHIGFTMWLRTVFGHRGTRFPIGITLVAGIIFTGMQAYYGGLACSVMLSAIIPGFAHMKNTLPASAAITTQQLIGFLIFEACYAPMCWFVRPHQAGKFIYTGFTLILAIMFGMLIWAVHENGGSAGPLMTGRSVPISGSNRAFRIAQCIVSITGTYGGASERYSDWTRYARSRQSPTMSMLFGMPFACVISALFGTIITSAYYGFSGSLQWNPILVLSELQATQYTPAVRAATFFAGAGFFISQLIVNMTNNTIGWGMDVSGIFPRYLSIRRASLLSIILSVLVQPWRFLSQAFVFVEILSVASIFFSCSCSMLTADYYLIRKRKLKIPDLFIGGPESIYWYSNGFNWRAIAALFFAMWPSIPGLVYSIKNETNGWLRIFQINYVVGAPLGFIAYMVLTYFSLPPGRGIQEDMDEESDVIEGISADGSTEGSIESETKEVFDGEKATIKTDVVQV